MTSSGDWFTETCEDDGTAASARVEERLMADLTAGPRLEVLRSPGLGRLLIVDGRVTLVERDRFIYHEMLVHPALYSHPHPRRVVIIGGEDGGCLSEVLKHVRIEEVVRLGTDRRLDRVCREHFPDLHTATEDPRVRCIGDDAIAWLEQADRGSVDVILVDAPRSLETTPGLLAKALHALGSQGLLVQASGSPVIHAERFIRPMHDAMRRAGFLDALTLQFPQSLYPTGWWTLTTACTDMPIMFCREEQAEEHPFETRYYNAAIHRTSIATPQFLSRILMA